MATGYTSTITETTTLREFATTCARAFGAAIMQRDEPLSEGLKLPEESPYYAESLAKGEKKLQELIVMTGQQAEAAAEADYTANVGYYQSRVQERQALRGKYERVLTQVLHWQAPSPEHQGLKDFMLQQLRESIKWDCDGTHDQPPVKQTGAQWLADAIAQVERTNEYDRRHLQEEKDRTNSRRQWIEQLLESLK